ncbi:MAG: primosomal protein N', partial [Candidatus Cloacimonetes bacterium]|nr:primosomal protein N' [Candidatus Cloacimonadota bacterium]
MLYYEIALPINLNKLFTYCCREEIPRGSRVLVPFHKAYYTGIIWQESSDKATREKIKEVLEIIDDRPLI